MPAKVTPPNPNVVFVVGEKLTPVAFRFLTNIAQALSGTPSLSISGEDVFQFLFGNVTLSSGNLATPNTLLPGNVGDIFISTNGGGGGILFGKTTGAPGSKTGWALIT